MRATIDWGMERERQRTEWLRRQREPRGTVEFEVEEPVAAEEPGKEPAAGQVTSPAPGEPPGNRGRL